MHVKKKQHCLWKSQVSYKLMAKSYLDETTCFSSMDESLETKPFIIVSEPHEKRVKGFPLDSLSIDIPSGKYYYDVDSKILTLTNNLHTYFISSEWDKISPFMKKELRYKWNGKKFNKIK